MKFKFILTIISLSVSLSSCTSLSDFLKLDDQEGFEASVAKLNSLNAEVKQHIGKHKDELRKIMGEPTKIISPSIWKNVNYDEEWEYSTGIILVNQQFRTFYIKDDKVADAEFNGIF